MSRVLHVPATHPLNKLNAALRARLVQAQSELIDMEFRTAGELLRRAFDDLKLNLVAPPVTAAQPVGAIADLNYKRLVFLFADLLRASGVPDQANRRQAANLAHRVQLLRAFKGTTTDTMAVSREWFGLLNAWAGVSRLRST